MELVFPLSLQLLRVESPLYADDEATLIARAKSGDVAALDSLLNCHRGRILNLAFQILRDRESAEDAAQEAFVRAFANLNSFRGQASFGTWLYRVALNHCLEKRRLRRPETESVPEESPAPARDADLKLALEWTLDQISEPLRIALILREWHGLSYEEMAQVCAVPVGTVRSRLNAARLEFRRLWSSMEGEER